MSELVEAAFAIGVIALAGMILLQVAAGCVGLYWFWRIMSEENKAERERDEFSRKIADAIKDISLERLRDLEIYAKSRSEEKDAENHKYPDNWSDVESKLIRLRMALSD